MRHLWDCKGVGASSQLSKHVRAGCSFVPMQALTTDTHCLHMHQKFPEICESANSAELIECRISSSLCVASSSIA